MCVCVCVRACICRNWHPLCGIVGFKKALYVLHRINFNFFFILMSDMLTGQNMKAELFWNRNNQQFRQALSLLLYCLKTALEIKKSISNSLDKFKFRFICYLHQICT